MLVPTLAGVSIVLLMPTSPWVSHLKPGLLSDVGIFRDTADGSWPYVDANPTLRVMALHALAYCDRLFYLEEVEEIRLADAAVYAGRRLHEELAADEGELV